MSTYLRLLATVLLIGGVVLAVVSTRWALGDEVYFRAARALERHPDHILFQAEYHAAFARHVAYVVTAVLSTMTAILGSAVMLGLASILRQLERRRA
jgi:hypothetical protein